MALAIGDLFSTAVRFSPSLLPKIIDSASIIKSAFDRYKSDVAVCFNGGKDATVLLDLVTRVSRLCPEQAPVRPFYLRTGHDFNEILTFLRESERFWSDIEPFEETTPGWPPAMRVSPIFKWGYHDIWSYVDALGIPVCELYKRGYTSIGTKKNTKPNPKLWCPQQRLYLHANKLENAEDERLGRV